MSAHTQLRDESLIRIAALSLALKDNLNGQAIIEKLYPDLDPNTVLRDLTVVNSLVRILTTTYTTLVEGYLNAEADSSGEPQSKDHASGGESGG